MSTLLPAMAVDLDSNGHAWYPFSTGLDDAVLYAPTPVLPLPTFCWAVLPDDDRPHLALDRTTIAELLYASALDPVWPLSDEQLAAIVLFEVERCHCDLSAAVERLATDAGDHPEACAERMTACLAFADRLTAPPSKAVETATGRKAIAR